MDFFSFGDPGLGLGSIFTSSSPNPLSNPANNPFGNLGGIVANAPAASSTSSDAQSWLKTLFPWANLGTEAFLADKAINNGSQLSFAANGTPVVGAVAQSLTSVLPIIVILVVLFFVVSLFKK
jgi:hypothetical protein